MNEYDSSVLEHTNCRMRPQKIISLKEILILLFIIILICLAKMRYISENGKLNAFSNQLF